MNESGPPRQFKPRERICVGLGILVLTGYAIWAWVSYPNPDEVHHLTAKTPVGDRSITVECFFPTDHQKNSRRLPTVVLLHGVEGTGYYRGFHLNNARQIADEGYAVLLVHYFDALDYDDLVIMKEGELDTGQIEDIIYGEGVDRDCWEEAVVESLKWAADQPDLDSDNLFLVGYSLGGCLALRCATKCSVEPDLPELRGLVVNFGCKFKDEVLVPGMPSTLFHHGGADTVIEPEKMHKTVAEMKGNGTKVNVFVYQNQPHTLDETSGALCRSRTYKFLQALRQTPPAQMQVR